MGKKKQRCKNPPCNTALTAKQIGRGGEFCSQVCGRADGKYKRYNLDPEFIATKKSGRGEW